MKSYVLYWHFDRKTEKQKTLHQRLKTQNLKIQKENTSEEKLEHYFVCEGIKSKETRYNILTYAKKEEVEVTNKRAKSRLIYEYNNFINGRYRREQIISYLNTFNIEKH